MAVMQITAENFKEKVTDSPIPVLVDFWASWCGPCRMMSPVVESLAADYEGKVAVGKINVDEQPELAAQFGVMSIPMLVLFKNGKPAATSVGYRPKEAIEPMLK